MHTRGTLLKLLDSLAQEAESKGFELSIEATQDEDTYLIANMENRKIACVGLTEINNTNVIASYLMNMKRWAWYKEEGFTTDDMVETKNIKNDIFEFVAVTDLIDSLL